MNLDDARHVLKNTARINEGGYVADCRDLILDELDRALARAAELEAVIREYVAQVESGERFDALVSSVPGLASDNGVQRTAGFGSA